MTHISLFAGIGGIDLAVEWAGFKTILMVEIDPFCQKVLNKHWPDVPIIGDIKDVTKERIMAYTQGWQSGEQEARNGRQDTSRGSEEVIANTNATGFSDRSKEHRGKQASERKGVSGIDRQDIISTNGETSSISPITLITGGFPCQPVSQAGQRRGTEDDRWLWPEMLRVISEIRPTWVVAENVAGLLNMGFNDCVSDLEGEGYETIPFLIPACAVNAPHRRDRIFIVGYSLSDGCENGHTEARREVRGSKQGGLCQFEGTGDVADSESNGMERGRCTKQKGTQRIISYRCSEDGPNTKGKRLERADTEGAAQSWGCPTEYLGSNWWAVEPELGRVAHGIPSRVDRLKCLGNAVVPQQIYLILKAIADIEVELIKAKNYP